MAANVLDRFEFRSVRANEAEEVAEIEKICFPPHEVCSKKDMFERVEHAPELFLVAVDKETGTIAGFLNGLATDEEAFRDEFFTDITVHNSEGKNIFILGLQDVVAKGMENPAYTLYGAKAIVLVACEKEAVNGVSDCSCAIENMLLAAHSLGLGACWINQLKYCGDKAEVADYLEGLGIDKDMQVVGMVGMGYPDEEREAAKRQDDLVTYLN